MKKLILDNYCYKKFFQDEKLVNRFTKLKDFSINGKVKKEDFSVYIGHKIQNTDYNLQYILCDEIKYINECIEFIGGHHPFVCALNKAYNDFLRSDMKVLLYLGKFPGYGKDIDGGSILAKQLIDTLKKRCKLDVAFIRKNNEIYVNNYIKNVFYYRYKDALNNKFIRRLKNLDTNIEALKDFEKYDKVVTAHVSKFFGCDFGESFWKKTILFPMFCTHSYQRAGEFVPIEYSKQECNVLQSVNKIITPSIEEKQDLISEYLISEDKINVIYRGIDTHIHFRIRKSCGDEINLICIGSIKKQKNNIMQLELLNKLIKNGIRVKLHLVTTIQEKEIYDEMLHYILINNLDKYIIFHISILQEELASLLELCDINISTSNWETFGRGIFEGISAGLPTLINNKLTVIHTIVGNNIGVKYLNTIDDFFYEIIKLREPVYYCKCSSALKSILHKVSYKLEQNKLADAILGIDNNEIN